MPLEGSNMTACRIRIGRALGRDAMHKRHKRHKT